MLMSEEGFEMGHIRTNIMANSVTLMSEEEFELVHIRTNVMTNSVKR